MMDRQGRVALEITTDGEVSLNSPLWRKWTLIRRNYVEKRTYAVMWRDEHAQLCGENEHAQSCGEMNIHNYV